MQAALDAGQHVLVLQLVSKYAEGSASAVQWAH